MNIELKAGLLRLSFMVSLRVKLVLTACFLAFGISLLPAQEATIRSGDSIEVRIGGVPTEEITQISGAYQIDEQGFVSMPHIGRIRAMGLTHSALQAAIENTYKSQGIYTNPTITINLTTGARFVDVDGAVRSRQRVPFTADMTVLTAIAAAGGFTEFANPKRVQLLRGSEPPQVINCSAARNKPELDVRLVPGDKIFVPESLGLPFLD